MHTGKDALIYMMLLFVTVLQGRASATIVVAVREKGRNKQ